MLVVVYTLLNIVNTIVAAPVSSVTCPSSCICSGADISMCTVDSLDQLKSVSDGVSEV